MSSSRTVFRRLSGGILAISLALTLSCTKEMPLTDEVQVVILEPGVENAYPRWSNDGQRILYQSNRSGKWQLQVINRDGSNDRALTAGEHNNFMADWSPDNSQIAFVSDRDGNEDIFVMAADGSGAGNLTRNPAREIHPAWAPDGQSIFFNSSRDNAEGLAVYQMTPAGENVTKISSNNDTETCPSLSPDQSKLVYLHATGEENYEVFVRDLASGEVINVSRSEASEGWPSWSPDGRVVFSSDREGTFNVYAAFPGSRELSRLTTVSSSWYDARAHMSPDGSAIVFNRQEGSTIAIVIKRL